MKVAFHFDADDPSVKGKYGLIFLARFFAALRHADEDRTAHVKIWHGDLGAWELGGTPKQRQVIGAALFGSQHQLWREIEPSVFLGKVFTTNVYVIAVEGLSTVLRDKIHAALRADDSYYGAIQVFEAIPAHWALYHRTLVPRYRYYCGQLRILCTLDEEDEKDTGLETHWRRSGIFESVSWESLQARHTIFESHETIEDARRLAQLDRMLPDDLSVMADDVLLRLSDEIPQLCDTLFAAFDRLRTVRTGEEAAQAALSCRRFMEGLADLLYPPRHEKVKGRKLDAPAYRNRLWAYIDENLQGDKEPAEKELNELGKLVDGLVEDANTGVHSHISRGELDVLLRRLVTVTYRLLRLAPPPLELPIEPHLDSIRTILFAKRDDSVGGD
jgi:hypothetical protein